MLIPCVGSESVWVLRPGLYRVYLNRLTMLFATRREHRKMHVLLPCWSLSWCGVAAKAYRVRVLGGNTRVICIVFPPRAAQNTAFVCCYSGITSGLAVCWVNAIVCLLVLCVISAATVFKVIYIYCWCSVVCENLSGPSVVCSEVYIIKFAFFFFFFLGRDVTCLQCSKTYKIHSLYTAQSSF